MPRLLAVLLVSTALAFATASAGAGDDSDKPSEKDRQACLVLSFAPLDNTIPACDRLIAMGKLDEKTLYAALMARAEASAWAITYRFGYEMSSETLLLQSLSDLDRAVGIARRLNLSQDFLEPLHRALSERASTAVQLARYAHALADYSEAISLAMPPWQPDLLGRSMVYERVGSLALAIDDMTALVERGSKGANLAGSLTRRGALHEAIGDREAALADYRAALDANPEQNMARKGVKRLERVE